MTHFSVFHLTFILGILTIRISSPDKQYNEQETHWENLKLGR